MSSFKLYLPSNASQQNFPNNGPSCFTTQFVNPIHLEGDWQVGVESIYYNSDIGNENELAKVEATYKEKTHVLVNDIYPFQHLVTKDGKWDYSWRKMPLLPNNDVKDFKSFEKALNSINDTIVKDLKHKTNNVSSKEDMKTKLPFQFHVNGSKISLTMSYGGLYIRLSNKLAKLLGYNYHVHLPFDFRNNLETVRTTQKMTVDDYRFVVFDRHVVKQHASIILKHKGEAPLSKTDFLQRWEKQVTKRYGVKGWFHKEKFIIQTSTDKMALVFSQPLRAYCHHWSIIGYDEFWADWSYGSPFPEYKDIVQWQEEWVLEVYKDDLELTERKRTHEFTYSFKPRSYDTVSACAKAIEGELNHWLPKYTKDRVTFNLKDYYSYLIIPTDMTCTISANLKSLFGFDQSLFAAGKHTSRIIAQLLDKREQELFLHVDVAEQTNYGTTKNHVLQHFIHKKDKKYGIVEKRFEPILYLPVNRNMIDSITVKILNAWKDCVYMRDSKTIVILHFQKLN